jgi:selenocysteine lyase/cysteine desulfurase
VRRAIRDHLDLEDGLGGYEAAEARADALEHAAEAVGRLLGTERRNIAFVQNSTAAFAQALSAFDLAAGDVILTSRADYASNQIMYLSLARRRGVEVVRAPDLPAGGVDPDAVRDLVRRRRPALVALTWIPTNSGLVQDVAAVGGICRAAGVPYLVDA